LEFVIKEADLPRQTTQVTKQEIDHRTEQNIIQMFDCKIIQMSDAPAGHIWYTVGDIDRRIDVTIITVPPGLDNLLD
jgi:hypothetical protein